MSKTRVLAHPIGGGWPLRHEGCAAFCCETWAAPAYDCLSSEGPDGMAKPVLPSAFLEPCDGCGAPLNGPPAPLTFNPDEACDACCEDA